VRAARRIGFPVVTKPYNGNHGRGISIRLTTDEEVAAGYAAAREVLAFGDRRDLPRRRHDHRLLVVNGDLVGGDACGRPATSSATA
jgi:cyanophycin synthetase